MIQTFQSILSSLESGFLKPHLLPDVLSELRRSVLQKCDQISVHFTFSVVNVLVSIMTDALEKAKRRQSIKEGQREQMSVLVTRPHHGDL